MNHTQFDISNLIFTNISVCDGDRPMQRFTHMLVDANLPWYSASFRSSVRVLLSLHLYLYHQPIFYFLEKALSHAFQKLILKENVHFVVEHRFKTLTLDKKNKLLNLFRFP